jgi:hypothetical protein
MMIIRVILPNHPENIRMCSYQRMRVFVGIYKKPYLSVFIRTVDHCRPDDGIVTGIPV